MNGRVLKWTMRAMSAGALLSQLVLATLVPLADARVEAESAARYHGPDHPTEVHEDHPHHDHHLCDLCRAISLVGLAVPTDHADHTPVPAAEPPVSVLVGDRTASSTYLPLGSRAPPAA